MQRPNRPRPRALVAAALLTLCGCASAPRHDADLEPDLAPSVATLANQLIDVAERRAGLTSMRVVVGDLVPVGGPSLDGDWTAGAGPRLGALELLLRQELELALASRVNVIGVEGALEQVASPFGATHAVVGTLAPSGSSLEMTLRLIALDTQLIVAPARGRLPIGLGDLLDDTFDLAPLEFEATLPDGVLSPELASADGGDEASLGGLVAVDAASAQTLATWEGPAATRIRLLRALGHGVPAVE